MTTTSFSNGARVAFKPGPRATATITGTVESTVTSGTGRGKATFLVVRCDDGRERKIRPGAARAA